MPTQRFGINRMKKKCHSDEAKYALILVFRLFFKEEKILPEGFLDPKDICSDLQECVLTS